MAYKGQAHCLSRPAGAMLEGIVHFVDADGRVPSTFDLLKIEAPNGLKVTKLDPFGEEDWKQHPANTRRMGDRWLASKESSMARVPSAIAPLTWNWLLNPQH